MPRSFALLTVALVATAATAQPVPSRDAALRLGDGRWLHVGFCGERTVHVRVTPAEAVSSRPSLVVVACEATVDVSTETLGDTLVVRTRGAAVRVNRTDGGLVVADGAGRVALRARAPDAFRPGIGDDAGVAIQQRFRLTPDEGLYGLGEFQDGVVNWRGEDVRLSQSNTMSAIPSLVSSHGWGLLWDNTSASTFRDRPGAMTLASDVADGVDYYVTPSTRPAEALAAYRRLTGKAPMFADWAYGYWQSKERYRTSDELLEVAADFRRRRFPVDNLVQDWNYWPGERWFSGMAWDRARYPDPAATVRALHDRYNLHVMLSVWPAVGVDSPVHAALAAEDHLFPMPHWAPAHVYDAFSAEARDTYFRFAKTAIPDVGVDAWWMDGSEPEFTSADDRYITEAAILANGPNALGAAARTLNAFSLVHTGGVYDHLRASAPQRRPLILTRSAFAGQQRNGAVLWSGDIWASWQTLQSQVAAGISVGAAGVPYWNSDIGGFITDPRFPDGLADPAYRELYVRWFEFGAFSPMFRSHGTNIAREPWRFGDPGSPEYDALLAATNLRYRLLPYLYTTAHAAYADDAPIVQALGLAFPDDVAVRDEAGAYFFGPSLLVHPVTKAMQHAPERIQEFVPFNRVMSPDGAEPGMEQAFFFGTDFERPAVMRRSEIFNLTWRGSLPPEVRDSVYSVRYTGMIRTQAAGRYTFVLMTNSGTRLALNGQRVLDQWDRPTTAAAAGNPWDQGATRTERLEVELPANTLVPVVLEYRQSAPNEAGVTLEWITPTRRQETVSETQTWPTLLPRGTVWTDFWSGETHAGGTTDTAAAPLDRIPLYVPAGTILPLGPEKQFASEVPADPLELRVYPGADATFTLYEDTGDGTGYEQGRDMATIPMAWNDAARTLTVGARAGAFDGMLSTRTLRIVLVRPGRGVGLAASPADREVRYDGHAQTLSL